MHLALLFAIGIAAFGIVQPFAINNVDVLRKLAENLQGKSSIKNQVEKESPPNFEYMDFYEALAAISLNAEKLYTVTFKELYGLSLNDFVGIPIGSDTFLHDLAFNLSEVNTLRDFADVCGHVTYQEVSNEEASMMLYILSHVKEPLGIISSKFRVVFKQLYHWAKKTNFAYEFPIPHTSVEEVEGLIDEIELFAQNVDVLLTSVPGYESIEHTPNTTANHLFAVQLLEYRTFMAFYADTGLADQMGLPMRQLAQKWMSLLQSKQVKQAVFGMSRAIPDFVNLLDKYGILALREPIDYPIY